jgi:sugar phosphate isomerase/epimerase
MSTQARFKLGTTTYSFNDEYYSYIYTLDDCLRHIGSLGRQQGVELVAPQCIRTFPRVSDEFEREFKAALERYDLRPSAFGHYADLSRISGRDLTEQELVDYSLLQLEGAHRLGFPLVRFSYFAGDLPDLNKALYRLLLKDAERLNLKLAMEIHCPFNIESAAQQRVIEDVAKLNSPFVGFTIDCGTMASRVSQVCIEKFLNLGLKLEIVERMCEMWRQRTPVNEMKAEARAMGGGELGELLAVETNVYFGHGAPAAMRDMMPYIYHVHGKFFDMEDSGADPSVRYPEIVSVLIEEGYDGFITSEYEGHHWLKNRNALRQVRAHQEMIERLAAELTAPQTALAQRR